MNAAEQIARSVYVQVGRALKDGAWPLSAEGERDLITLVETAIDDAFLMEMVEQGIDALT